jgi:hypothetical protein
MKMRISFIIKTIYLIVFSLSKKILINKFIIKNLNFDHFAHANDYYFNL